MSDSRRRANTLPELVSGCAIVYLLVSLLIPQITSAQGLTGALIGTVTDSHGGVISGASA